MWLLFQPPLWTIFYTSSKYLTFYALNKNIDNFVYITKKYKLKDYCVVNIDKASSYKVCNMNRN